MTTYRGIAVVTETLRYMLSQAAAAVPNTTVRIGPPESVEPGGGPAVTIFLYHVHPAEHLRHVNLPTRDADGQLLADPAIALELDYVVSFAGADNTPEPELLLGATVAAFHTTPFITQSTVTGALSSQSWLKADDLSYRDRAPITLLSLSAEERSNLWSAFFQVPYRLSVEYRVGPVFLPA